jgi:hypothetical protein
MPPRPAEREGRLEGRPSPQHYTETGNHHEADAADASRHNGQRVGGAKRRPQFIRVLPDEVALHGPHAAIVLAHIRFRCQADGPGRVQADGVWWWRVSLVDMAEETGLSVRGVRTALKTLGDAVAAKHFKPLSNQSRAYRVTAHQNGADLPVVEIDISDGEIDISTCRNRHLYYL